jgi:chromosome segregation ATPase
MNRTPTSATITGLPEKLAQAPRTRRAPAPTIKVRENQALNRTRQTTRAEKSAPLRFRDVEDSDDDYGEENGDIAASLEKLITLVKELKQTIDRQNEAIQEAQTELKEVKEEQQYVKEQNNELKNKIGMLRN